jgi:TPP-dependent pyruvate/acetoin dehydrogenase alpha subunit
MGEMLSGGYSNGTRPMKACSPSDDRDAARSLSKDQLHEMLRRMLKIRLFEESAVDMYEASQMPGFVHIAIGQEATVVGACMALRDDDYITGNHRSHGHPIAKGAELGPLMAELLGKETGVCHGKGGSMHLAAFSVGSLGESGIVGSLMPVAVGAGLSARMRGTDQVCVCFFGDGAANCGPFHESLNLAAIWKLPVIFFCENNGYASTTAQGLATAVPDIAMRAGAYAMPGIVIDGQDVLAVYGAVSTATARARANGGPSLIEAKTYRYRGHSEPPGSGLPAYRSDAEVLHWRARDPIHMFSATLIATMILDQAELDNMRASVVDEVAAAVAFAKQSPMPDPSLLLAHIFA